LQDPTTIPIRKYAIPAREITRISHGTKMQMNNLGPTFPTIFNHPIINKIFPTKLTVFFPKFTNRDKIDQFGEMDGESHQDPRFTHTSCD